MRNFDQPMCGVCFEYGHLTNDCKEVRSDFDLIGPIAAFIGARLQHPTPPCNGRNPYVSTIHVDQYKEKFWDVRVYCTLAATAEVEAKWTAWKREGHPDEPFYAQCFLSDARHYRTCYLEMIALVPRLQKRICRSADHPFLLQDSAELACDLASQWFEQWEDHPDTQGHFLASWRVSTLGALCDRLRLIYDVKAGQKAAIADDRRTTDPM